MNIDDIIQSALLEDLPNGDITTDCLQVGSRVGRALLIAKDDLILSGNDLFEKVIYHFDSRANIQWLFKTTDLALKGQTLASIQCDWVSLLKAERVALNFLGRLCGIATLTHCFVKQIEGTRCKITDTRKTTPLLRALEKKAVVDGGGVNHRMSLSDAVMIKDNHIALAGGIKKAVDRIREKTEKKIEVETKTREQVIEAVQCKVDRIMLDNMSNELMKELIPLIPFDIEIEASGNMTLERVRSVAELGVHFISVGALTHSAPSADISLNFL